MAKRRRSSTVGAYEAKTNLGRLLEEVAAGATVTITKHGLPVARLVPAASVGHADAEVAIASLRQARRGVKLKGISLKELIEQGRR